MDPSQVCTGEQHCALGERGHGRFDLVRKDSKKEESQSEKLCIPIFLTVAQDEPYKKPVTYFFQRFYENISTKCVNDSCLKEKPSRDK